MKLEKMSLKSIRNTLTQEEMKKVMAGSGDFGCGTSCAPTLCHNSSSTGNCVCDGSDTACH